MEPGMPHPPVAAPAMVYMHQYEQQQAQPHPQHSQAGPHMPPISEMLVREAEAWRALLSLHSMSLNGTRQVAETSSTEELSFNQAHEESDQRESMYYSAISHLLSQYDTLTSELIKIRSLRKAKRSVEVVAQREVLRAHSDETLALGSIMATHTSQSVTGLTSELRKLSQKLRSQLEQTRVLLQALQEVRDSNMPAGTSIVIGLQQESDSKTYAVSEVLQQIYAEGDGKVTEESILNALRRLSNASPTQTTTAQSGRTVPRRNNAV